MHLSTCHESRDIATVSTLLTLQSVKRGGRAAAGVMATPDHMVVALAGRRVAALTAAASWLSGWQPLNDAVAGQHAAIHRKVPAHHEGSHGGIFLGQDI